MSTALPLLLTAAPIFHHGLDAGSESQFNAFNVIVNVGLCSFGRLGMPEDRLFEADWGRGWSRLGAAYADPVGSIQRDGSTRPWLMREFAVPAIFWVHPNVYFHFLGEGMLSRKLEEDFQLRGYGPGWSKALAIGTIAVAQQLNEASEQMSPFIDQGDPLGDMFWNVAGIAAFQWDAFARLFSNPSVSFFYWPGQPVLDVQDGTLLNHGEHFALRTTLGAWTSWRLSYVSGLPALFALGPAVPLGGGHWLTVAPGADLDVPGWLNASVFWDHQGSLMTSLVVRTDLKGFRLNVYPQVDTLGAKLGLYADVHGDRASRPSSVGLTLSLLPVVPGVQF